MAIDLTTIFGTAIKVTLQPVTIERQYNGFVGGHGLTAMHLGSRGRFLLVTGILWYAAATYALARAGLQASINNTQLILFEGIADFYFYDDYYYNVLWDSFELLPDGTGKTFHWTRDGIVTAEFICRGRCLI